MTVVSLTGVLDCDFIERGRNVVSASRDGTALLHDVPTQTIIARYLSLRIWSVTSFKYPH